MKRFMYRIPVHVSIFMAMLVMSVLLPAAGYEVLHTEDGELVNWRESCFLYTVHEDGARDINSDHLSDAIRASFDEWEKVGCSYFSFKETEPASCIEIGFNMEGGNMNLLVWRKKDWAYQMDAMALTTLSYDDRTGRILDADVEMNDDMFYFSIGDDAGIADVRNTLTHEIGHMVGLDHSDDTDATMYAIAIPGERNKRTLEKDDINGICHLYPSEEDPETCQEPVCGLSTDCSVNDCVAMEKTENNDCSVANPGRRSTENVLLKLIPYLIRVF